MEPNDALGVSCVNRNIKLVTVFVIDDLKSECAIDTLGNLHIHLRTATKSASQPFKLTVGEDANWSIQAVELD
jgi:hypothetical protein